MNQSICVDKVCLLQYPPLIDGGGTAGVDEGLARACVPTCTRACVHDDRARGE